MRKSKINTRSTPTSSPSSSSSSSQGVRPAITSAWDQARNTISKVVPTWAPAVNPVEKARNDHKLAREGFFRDVLTPLLELTKADAVHELEAQNVPSSGSQSRIFCRLLILRLLDKPHLRNLDSEVFTTLFAHWAKSKRALHPLFWENSDKISTISETDFAIAQEVMRRLDILLPSRLQADAAGVEWSEKQQGELLQRLLALFFDIRPRVRRQSYKKVEIEEWAAAVLGYTREDLEAENPMENLERKIKKRDHQAFTSPSDEDRAVGRNIKEGIWRPEYNKDPSFCLSCLKTLFLKTIKAREIEKEALSKYDASPVEDVEDSVNSLEGKTLRDLLLDSSYLTDDPFRALLNLDADFEKRQKELDMRRRVLDNARVNIPKLLSYLPSSNSATKETESFKYAFIDQADNEAHRPVVANKTLLSDGTRLITEIGIRCDGYWFFEDYEDVKSDCGWILAVPESAKCLRWSPGETHRESGRSLESALFSHGPDGSLLSYLYIYEDNELFQIDLRRRELIATQSSNTQRFHCACSFSYSRYSSPIDSRSSNIEDVVFLRMILLVHPPPTAMGEALKELATDPHQLDSRRIVEPGSLLAEVFNVALKASKTRERPFEIDSIAPPQPPIVMYRVSSFVRSSSALSNLQIPYRVAVERLLGISDEENDDPREMQEARALLAELILTSTTGKHTAIISDHHAVDIKTMLVDKCIIPIRWVFVEQANYVSAMRNLQNLTAQSTLTFCFAEITNRLSALDIGRLIDTVQGTNVRLLIFSYPSLLFTLRVVGKLNSVILPPSIEESMSKQHYSLKEYRLDSQPSSTKASSWRVSRCFGSVQELILSNPELIRPSKESKKWIRNGYKAWTNWEKFERGWRQNPGDTKFLILVADEMSESKISLHYKHPSTVLDCRQNSWQQLKNRLDTIVQRTPSHSNDEVPVIVFTKAQLLSDIHIRHIAERCANSNTLFVLVLPQLNPQQLTIRAAFSTGKTELIHGHYIRCVSDSTGRSTGLTPEKQLAVEVLYLLLGPLFSVAVEHGEEAHVLDPEFFKLTIIPRITASDSSLCSTKVLLDMHQAIVATACGSDKSVGDSPLHSLIARYITIRHRSSQKLPVPFYWFCQLDSMSQFLPQSMRIARWLLFLQEQPNDAMDWVNLVAKATQISCNIHSLHLLHFFRASDSSDQNKAVPKPSYRCVKYDNSISEQELLLQQCIQTNELAWDDLESRWSVFPHSADILIAILRVYYQPIKFLSILPLSSLFYALEGISSVVVNPSANTPGAHAIEVLIDFVCSPHHAQSRTLLEQQGIEARGVLSVVRWVVLRFLSRPSRVVLTEKQLAEISRLQHSLQVNEDDINVLIQHSVPIEIPREGGIATYPVLRILVSLDSRDDLISQQMHLRDYFVRLPHDAADFINVEGFGVGRLFVQFLLSPYVTAATEGILVSTPDFAAFAKWVRINSDDESEHTLLQSRLTRRLSVSAIALLLSRASFKSQAVQICDIIRLIAHEKQMSEKRLFFDVIRALESDDHLPSIVVSIMNTLVQNHGGDANDDSEETQQGPSEARKLYGAVWNALQLKSFKPIAEVARSKSSNYGSLTIPLSHESLLSLYVQLHTDDELGFPRTFSPSSMEKHVDWFSLSDSFLVLSHLLARPEILARHRGLLFLNWLRNPYVTIPVFPEASEMSCIEEMIRITDADVEVARAPHQCSNSALLLIAPFCVPTSIYKQQASQGSKSLEQRNYLLAQKDHAKFPPFFTSATMRPLPLDVLEFLSKQLYVVQLLESLDVIELSYDVGSGVSIDLVRLNLNALLNATRLTKGFPAQPISVGSKASVLAVILLWFKCMGVSIQHLAGWEIFKTSPELSSRLDDAQRALVNFSPKETAALPLPGVIDVTYRLRRLQIIKGTSREDVDFTLKVFAPLFGDSFVRVESKVRRELAQHPLPKKYMSIDVSAARAVLKCIAGIMVSISFDGNKIHDHNNKSVSELTSEVDRICSVIKTLQDCDRSNKSQGDSSSAVFTRNGLGATFLRCIMEGIANRLKLKQGTILKVAPSADHQSLFFRLMFSRLGVTTDHDAELISLMFDVSSDLNIVPDEGSWREFVNLDNLGILDIADKWKSGSCKSRTLTDPRQNQQSSIADLDSSQLVAGNEDWVNRASATSTHRLRSEALQIFLASSPQDLSANKQHGSGSVDHAANAKDYLEIPEFFKNRAISAEASKSEILSSSSSNGSSIALSPQSQLSLHSGSVIDCRELLQLKITPGYAKIIVKPGSGGVLRRPPLENSIFVFEPHDKQANMHHRMHGSGTGAILEGSKLVAHFSSNGEAWESIHRESSFGVVLVLDGMALKRSLGVNWTAILLSDPKTHIMPWELIKAHNIINYNVFPEVLDVVSFLCSYVASLSGFNGDDHAQYLCERSLDANSCKKDSETIAACYELVSKIQDTLSNPQTRSQPAEDIINQVLRSKPVFNQFIAVPTFKGELIDKLERCSSVESMAQLQAILETPTTLIEFLDQRAQQDQEEKRQLLVKNLDKSHLLGRGSSLEEDEEGQMLQPSLDDEYYSEEDSFSSSSGASEEPCLDWLFPAREKESDDRYQAFSDDEDSEAGPKIKQPSPASSANLSSSSSSQQVQKTPTVFETSVVLPLRLGDKVVADSLFYYPLDLSIHKNVYSPTMGRDLAYLLPRNLVTIAADSQSSPAPGFTKWLVDVLRSPLSEQWKSWFVQMCSADHVCLPPSAYKTLSSSSNGTAGGAGGDMSLVIANCLARRCPYPKVKRRLSGAVVLPSNMEPFCRRKNGQYGIYFCNTHTLQRLRDANFALSVIDLGAFHDAPQDDLYLQIVGCFDGFTSFAYVRGLRKIDDLLLKWCAEYTERCPWSFIYFENTDTMFNFSENRDRCDYSLYNWPSVGELVLPSAHNQIDVYETQYAHVCLSTERAVQELYESWVAQGTASESSAEPRWRKKAKAIINGTNPFVLLLISPPGAGKTQLMRTILETQANVSEPIDCSNDELVERAMQDVLTERFAGLLNANGSNLLVADEFHMLKREQKSDLLRWTISRNIQRVVLICNRSDDFDFTLLQEIKSKNSQLCAEQIFCRLSVAKVLKVLKKTDKVENAKVLRQVEMWCAAARALFGEESLSLRTRDTLVNIFSSENQALEQPLASFLLQKLPNLGEYTCWQFAHEICLLANKKKVPLPSETCHPMQLLVRAAVQDPTCSIISFPEFSSRLQNANKYHPLIRLAAWLHVVYQHAGIDQKPPIDRLFTLRVIDQVGFPLVLSLAGEKSNLTSSLAFGARGEYSDLDWLASTVQHGYAINWAEVKELWQSNFVTDVPQLKRLVSVCPAPSLCLSALAPANLADIIEAADVGFARDVVSFYTASADEVDKAHSPLFCALWFLMRNELSDDLPNDFQEISARVVDTRSGSGLPDSNKSTLVCNMLLWASRFGFHRLDVKSVAKKKTEGLLRVLQLATEYLVNEISSAHNEGNVIEEQSFILKVIRLWSGVFARLLSTDGQYRTPPRAQLILASSQFPAHSSWPKIIQKLSRVVYRRADSSDLDSLRRHELFYPVSAKGSVVFRFPSKEVMLGILSMKNIDLFWQLKLLESSEYEIPVEFRTWETIRKLEQGLRKMTKVLPQVWDAAIGKRALEAGLLQTSINVQLPGARDAATGASVAIGRKKQLRLQKVMANLKRFCSNPEILKYYNEHAGMSEEKIRADPTVQVELDKNNNLKGNRFDLGRDGSFVGFSVMVGIFFRRTHELDRRLFFNSTTGEGCGSYLQEQKGFKVELIFDEDEFAQKLDGANPPDEAWIISGDQLDWQMHLGEQILSLERVQNFVDAVERYSMTGRGLFIMAENYPFYYHANLVLERICGARLDGDWPAEQTLRRGTHWATEDPSQSAASLLSAITFLFEGSTICEPVVRGYLRGLARNSNPNKQKYECLLYADQTDKYGRVCVDTGFTKLWKNWDGAGTARFYGNVAVWLLSLDYRLGKSAPTTGALGDPSKLGFAPKRTPRSVEPLGIEMELVIVLDQSGSVGSGWRDTVRFCRKVVEKLQLASWANRVAIVPFTHTVGRFLNLSHNRQEIMDFIHQLEQQSATGGTSFAAAMQYTYNILTASRPGARRMVIFETDGADDYARPARDSVDTMICVAVGQGASVPQIQAAFRPLKTLSASSFDQLSEIMGEISDLLNARAEKK